MSARILPTKKGLIALLGFENTTTCKLDNFCKDHPQAQWCRIEPTAPAGMTITQEFNFNHLTETIIR